MPTTAPGHDNVRDCEDASIWIGPSSRSDVAAMSQRVGSPTAARIAAVRRVAPAAELHAQVVHVRQPVARRVRLAPPLGGAQQARVEPRPDPDDERDARDLEPTRTAGHPPTTAAANAGVASRQPPSTTAGGPGRLSGGPSLTTRPPLEFDDALGGARDLAVVRDDHHTRPGARLLVQQLEDLHAGAVVELAGRLVREQHAGCRSRGRARSRRAVARRPTAGSGSGRAARRARHRAAPSRATRPSGWPRDVDPELHVLERGEAGEEVERLEDERDRRPPVPRTALDGSHR